MSPTSPRSDGERPWLEADRRPDGVDDETVEAMGKLGEAMEWIERARGRLYDFHQMCGHSDLLLGEAADQLEDAGHAEIAERLRSDLVGRNILEGRWSFQVVEEYDATYWSAVRGFVDQTRDELVGGRHHVFESEMKERRRSHGLRHHERRPPEADRRADDPTPDRDAAARPTEPAPRAFRMETEAEAIARLRDEGFDVDLRLDGEGRLLADDGDPWPTSEVSVVELVRFEGMSDPSDESMVLAIERPDGRRGTVALPYGPTMTAAHVDASRALLLRRDRRPVSAGGAPGGVGKPGGFARSDPG